jgi:hypothetical protein
MAVHKTPRPHAPASADPTAWVTNAANSPQIYDIYHGAPYYTSEGANGVLNFAAARWLAGTSTNLCNCYDCAGAVWYYASLDGEGTATRYVFLEPFGYLAQTWLKQRGQCNNPFYGATGGPEIIGETDAARTAFRNHAFVQYTRPDGSQVILDACAGPSLGTLDPQGYIAHATDADRPVPPKMPNGTVDDITFPYHSLSYRTNAAAPAARSLHLAANAERFMSVMGIEPDAGGPKDVRPAPWEALKTLPGLGPGWALSYEEIVPGYPETVGHRTFTRGDESVTLELYVASDDPATARRRFVERGSSHQSPEPIFGPGPPGLGELSARSSTPQAERYLWLDGNIVYDVRGPAAVIESVVRAVTDAAAKTRAVPASFPQAGTVAPSAADAAVGERLSLSLAPSDHLIEVEEHHPGLQVERHGATEFALHAQRPAEGDVVVIAVDRRTLLSSASAAPVRIRP